MQLTAGRRCVRLQHSLDPPTHAHDGERCLGVHLVGGAPRQLPTPTSPPPPCIRRAPLRPLTLSTPTPTAPAVSLRPIVVLLVVLLLVLVPRSPMQRKDVDSALVAAHR
jgi:hypothetical protein